MLLAIASCSSPKTKFTPLTNYDISVTIAMPNEFKYDQYFAQEVDSLNTEYKNLSKKYSSYKKYSEERDSLEIYYKDLLLNDTTLNINKINTIKSLLFSYESLRTDTNVKNIDYKIFLILQNLSCNSYILNTYKEMMDFSIRYNKKPKIESYLLIADTTTLSDYESFARIASINKTQYVLNVKKLEIKHYENSDSATMHFQLFDAVNDRFIFDDEFTEDARIREPKKTITTSRIKKYIDNILFLTSKDITDSLIHYSWFIDKSGMRNEKINIFISKLLEDKNRMNWAKDLVKRDIERGLISKYYDPSKMFCVLENEDKTKFASVFLHKDNSRWFGKLNVMKEADGETHHYMYIVVGEKYKDRWYLEPIEPTEVHADSLSNYKENILKELLQKNTFDEEKMFVQGDIWNTGIFMNVDELLENSSKKKESILTKLDQQLFKPFKGMTVFVAAQYRTLLAADYEEREYPVFSMLKKLETFAKQNYNNLTFFTHRNNLEKRKQLIYDKEMTKILIPYYIKLPNNEIEVSAFYYDNIGKQVFKLIHKKISKIIRNHYDKELEEYFLPHSWNWEDLYMREDSFWNEVVLKKENGEFINLTKIELE